MILTRQVQKCVVKQQTGVGGDVSDATAERGISRVLDPSSLTSGCNGELSSGSLSHHPLLYICSNIFECIVCAVLGVFSCIIFSFDLVVISNEVILGIFNYSWMFFFYPPQ